MPRKRQSLLRRLWRRNYAPHWGISSALAGLAGTAVSTFSNPTVTQYMDKINVPPKFWVLMVVLGVITVLAAPHGDQSS